jgi:hypothetical protein
MASQDSANFDSALKDFFTPEAIDDLGYEDNPLHAMLPKDTTFEGRQWIQPANYGRPQGRSRDATKAMANKTPAKYVDFNVPVVDDFASISIERKVMKQSRGKKGAFLDARIREIEEMVKTLVQSQAFAEYRNGSGARGRISATVSPTTDITLMEPEDIVNFEVGQTLVFADNETTGSVHQSGGVDVTRQVTAVNESAGSFTINATLAAGPVGTSDWIFVDGDRNAAISGLLDWFPVTAPTAGDSQHGVDRSVHVSRLAGQRIDVSAVPIAEGSRRALALLGRGGSYPTHEFMSHAKFRDLELELENKVVYVEQNVSQTIGFTGVKLTTGKKPITVYADHNCPDAQSFQITLAELLLFSMGPVPDMFDDDDVSMLREVGNWGYEVRADVFCNLIPLNTKNHCTLTRES